MGASLYQEGVQSGRLEPDAYLDNFADLHAPLDGHEAAVAADRCYFCHDAPCMTACPTSIDIPLFIRQIATGTPEASAKTIFEQNILGGMCARVCPTETLCEEVCVRQVAEGTPVEIGRLQRYATDTVQRAGAHPFERAAETGKSVGVVGAGPAGLSAAHRLAMHGHDVVIYEAKPKPGGLNEYGLAAYKTVDGFAQAEIDWLLRIGGIELRYEQVLGDGLSLASVQEAHDAVFLGVGLADVNALDLPGADLTGVEDAVAFIEGLRQAGDFASVPVGRDVVVIGGGMTAVDAAVQAKLLGALNVTLVYRGPKERMKASLYEQDLAASKGVNILHNASPARFTGEGRIAAVEFTHVGGDTVTIAADQVLIAIGQKLKPESLPDVAGGKIAVTGAGRTSVAGVWAGGDCASGGDDLTVTAVAEGRDAAEDIHASLMA